MAELVWLQLPLQENCRKPVCVRAMHRICSSTGLFWTADSFLFICLAVNRLKSAEATVKIC